MFKDVREATWKAILIILGLQVIASFLVNAVVFQGAAIQALGRVYLTTKGWVHPDLIANLVPLAVVIGGGVFGVAGLRPEDLGVTRASILPAVAVTMVFWLALQAVFGLVSVFQGGLAWYSVWREHGPGFVLGGLLGQLFGNALAEEVVFRGLLFPQLLLKMRRRWGQRKALVLAGLMSQAVFALLHIPNYLFVHHERFLVMDFVRLVLNGLLLLLVFLTAQNLLVAVGVHALWNTPASLFEPPMGFTRYLIVVGCTLALIGAGYFLRETLFRERQSFGE